MRLGPQGTQDLELTVNGITQWLVTELGEFTGEDYNVILRTGSADTVNYLEMSVGDNVPVSPANCGRLRYNVGAQQFEISEDGGAWAALGGGGGGTLMDAYNFGGAGAGRMVKVNQAGLAPILLYYDDFELLDPAVDQDNNLTILYGNAANDGLGIQAMVGASGWALNIDAANSGKGIQVQGVSYALQATSAEGSVVTGTSFVDRAYTTWQSAAAGSPILRVEADGNSWGQVSWTGGSTPLKIQANNADLWLGGMSPNVVRGELDTTKLRFAQVEVTNPAGGAPTGNYVELGFGGAAAVAPASRGRFRYNTATNTLQFSNNGGAYADISSSLGVTLDGAYDFGGAGVGRAITVDSGAVTMTNSAADDANVLEVTKSPVGSRDGSAIVALVDATANDPVIRAVNEGMGFGTQVDDDRGGLVLEEAVVSLGTHNSPVLAFHVDYIDEGAGQNRLTWGMQGTVEALGADSALEFTYGSGDVTAGARAKIFSLDLGAGYGVRAYEGARVDRLNEWSTGMYVDGGTFTAQVPIGSSSVATIYGGSAQFTTGAAIGWRRMLQLTAPTYTATAATQTITDASTLYINSAPVGSTNVTITNPYAIWADAGVSRLDDGVLMEERAAAPLTVVGGYGALWARNLTPSALFYTDDTAADFNLVTRAHGEIYVYNYAGTQTTNATPGNFDIITAFNTASGYNGASYLNTNAKASNKITCGKTGKYTVGFSASFGGTPASTFTCMVYVNGVAQNNVRFSRKLGTGGDVGRAACSGIVSVTSGQDVDVRVASDGASDSFALKSCNLHMTYLGVH